MKKLGRVICFLAVAAFWAKPALRTPVAAAMSQSSPPDASPTQSGSTAVGNASAEKIIPEVLRGPVQPIPFSHKEHAGTLKMPCEFCHSRSASGSTLKIPQTEFCMRCHQTLGTGDPGVEKLRAYAKTHPIIPWIRIYQLPSFVDFSHQTHTARGLTCEQCHGPVAERTQLFQESDISMAACIRCHQTYKAPTGCDTCHEIND